MSNADARRKKNRKRQGRKAARVQQQKEANAKKVALK